MSDLESALQRAAAAQWVNRLSKAGLDEAKAKILDQLGPGDRMHARMAGKDIATISVTQPTDKEEIIVSDEAAFLAWVKKNRPDAITEVVADWFRAPQNLAALLESSGEFPDGVDIITKQRSPYVTVRISDTQSSNLNGLASHEPLAGLLEGDTK